MIPWQSLPGIICMSIAIGVLIGTVSTGNYYRRINKKSKTGLIEDIEKILQDHKS